MRKVLCVLLVLTGAAYTASSTGNKKLNPTAAPPVVKQVVVSIDSSGNPQVDPDPVDINWVNGDYVKWVPGPGVATFSIRFTSGTPFSQTSFASSGPSILSGAPKANSGGTYEYSVTANGRNHNANHHVSVSP
jgi:hypothetical protein